MLYMEMESPRKSAMKMARHALRAWGSWNRDGTGLALDNNEGKIVIMKTGDMPNKFYGRNHIPKSRRFAGHVRAGTDGGVCAANAHPFVSCDGKSAFMHNGVIYEYEKVKERLVAKGHKFTSQTDSEVMLHLGEEVGPEKLMEAMRKYGIQGKANWIWVMPDRTVAFSDGSLYLVENENGLQVGLFSDLQPFGRKFFKKARDLTMGTLVVIEKGGAKTSKTETINGGVRYVVRPASDYGYQTVNYARSVPSPWIPGTPRIRHDDNDDMWHALRSGYDGDEPMFKTRELNALFPDGPRNEDERTVDEARMSVDSKRAAIKMLRNGSKREVDWMKAGDWFCKSCSYVFVKKPASERCSICYGTIVSITES